MDSPLVGIWDADFIPFIICHNKKDAEAKTLEQCIQLCDEFIESINTTLGLDYYVGFLTKGKCFRYEIEPNYKANRKYDNLPTFMNEVRDHLALKYGFKNVEEYEADDLVLSYKKHNSTYDCIIISPDKDLLNLEGTNYNPRKGEIVHCSKEDSELYFWKSMLIGDVADNIKGCFKIGPAKAEVIVKDKGIFESLREAVLEQYCKTYGEREGIRQFYVNYYMLKLVDDVDPKLLDVKLNKVKVLSE